MVGAACGSGARAQMRRLLGGLIAVIPFAVVVVAVLCMVHGLLMLLGGDETTLPVVWAIGCPILVVLAGLAMQMLLVSLSTRLYGSVDYEPDDESPFL